MIMTAMAAFSLCTSIPKAQHGHGDKEAVIFVRSSSTWAQCSTTRLPLMQMLTSE
jgi:hypothetical protein